jgi:hypothetical protein
MIFHSKQSNSNLHLGFSKEPGEQKINVTRSAWARVFFGASGRLSNIGDSTRLASLQLERGVELCSPTSDFFFGDAKTSPSINNNNNTTRRRGLYLIVAVVFLTEIRLEYLVTSITTFLSQDLNRKNDDDEDNILPFRRLIVIVVSDGIIRCLVLCRRWWYIIQIDVDDK